MSRLCWLLQGAGEFVSSHRSERALNEFQRVVGDHNGMALEYDNLNWLEDRYDSLHRELDLNEFFDP